MSGKIYCLTDEQIESLKAEAKADAIEEFKNALTEDLIKLKDKYFDLAKGTTMSERYTHLKRMDTVELIIEQIKLKSEQMQKEKRNEHEV